MKRGESSAYAVVEGEGDRYNRGKIFTRQGKKKTHYLENDAESGRGFQIERESTKRKKLLEYFL